jgi:hypothetical protein
VGAVIPPWNFPCAIALGMTSAAIVAGNAVVLKPASQSPWTAYRLCQLFWEVGLPAGVLNFLTGPGSVVGNRIVEHPRTRFVAFTGSKEVGIDIFERAAKVHPGQIWLKRTLLEMVARTRWSWTKPRCGVGGAGHRRQRFRLPRAEVFRRVRAIIVDQVYGHAGSRRRNCRQPPLARRMRRTSSWGRSSTGTRCRLS